MANYSKHMPSDCNIYKDKLTFLTDKKIDERLYGYYMTLSKVLEEEEEKLTVVYKHEIPIQKDICKILHYGSTNTYRTHLK